ncbi:MAG: TetR/AcrR family transcriptional regulator [Leptolyngbyaceae cyanobacterium SM1_3_5]|nr:TetR/AcrR family transcriptional regulator [Leptolyngbyaceae cyanobacterium SM1_3_5]
MEPAKASSTRPLSSEKTAAILEGAMQVFLEQGYVGTTMDRVAAASKVSKPTVYSHFRDKEALFNALIEQWVQKTQWATPPLEMLQPSATPPQTVLRQFANSILDSCTDSPEKITFIRLILGESGRFPALGQAFVQDMDKPVLEVLTQYLSACPELDLLDPQSAAYMFVGTLIFFLTTHVMLHGRDILRMDRDRLVDHLIAVCCTANRESER